jgi:nanoRNase/pAp phosphatase (c-di-AMP/oligoRNAs hydrolase)
MKKRTTLCTFQRNRVIDRIIDSLVDNKDFLVLGHVNPDDDCIASMVAISLIIKKFNGNAALYIAARLHDHFKYLINICEYNSIRIITPDNIDAVYMKNFSFDALVICDTAKPEMIQSHVLIDPLLADDDILKIEIDHHLGGDSTYSGSPGYRLVSDATSASELVGQILLRLSKKRKLLSIHHVDNPVSRNLILSILTGIVGDTSMGKYLKSRKTRKYYRLFTSLYSGLLNRETVKKTNFSNIEEVYGELSRLSSEEENCYNLIMGKKRFSPSIGHVVLHAHDVAGHSCFRDNEVLVSVSRAVADALAEESAS